MTRDQLLSVERGTPLFVTKVARNLVGGAKRVYTVSASHFRGEVMTSLDPPPDDSQGLKTVVLEAHNVEVWSP